MRPESGAEAPVDDGGVKRAEERELVEVVLSGIRHDVRNKLASARQANYFLKMRTQTSDAWVKDPRIERFFALIDEELEAADKAFLSPASLAALSERAPGLHDPAMIAAGAARRVDAPDRVDAGHFEAGQVWGDAAEIIVALKALVQNGLDAAPAPARVALSGAMAGGLYAFTIADAGEGIDEAAFRRSVRSPTQKRPGHRGFGLTIARRIADRYGGSLELGSAPRGAVVRISFSTAPPVDELASEEPRS